jgi:hypothetical protein
VDPVGGAVQAAELVAVPGRDQHSWPAASYAWAVPAALVVAPAAL